MINPKISNILNISPDTIRKNGGAWLVNVNKPSNFESFLRGLRIIKIDRFSKYLILQIVIYLLTKTKP